MLIERKLCLEGRRIELEPSSFAAQGVMNACTCPTAYIQWFSPLNFFFNPFHPTL